jgi:hypothetical protein
VARSFVILRARAARNRERQNEQHGGCPPQRVGALLHVTEVVEDDDVEGIEPSQCAGQSHVAFGGEQRLHELERRREEDGVAVLDERVPECAGSVSARAQRCSTSGACHRAWAVGVREPGRFYRAQESPRIIVERSETPCCRRVVLFVRDDIADLIGFERRRAEMAGMFAERTRPAWPRPGRGRLPSPG